MAMTTDDPKDYRINLRVNEEMNKRLFEESSKQGLSVAEYVRNLINDSFSKPKYDGSEELIQSFFYDVELYKKEYDLERNDLIKLLENRASDNDSIVEKASNMKIYYEKYMMAEFNFYRLRKVVEQYLKDE